MNIITTVLQETFYRVPDLYTGVLNIPRDLQSLQLKYILEARYYAILRNVQRNSLVVTNSFRLTLYTRASCTDYGTVVTIFSFKYSSVIIVLIVLVLC